MKEIVILGAGFGGLESAIQLKEKLREKARVTLIDKKEKFFMGLAKLWIVSGERKEKQCYTDISLVRKKGINFVKSEIKKIDTQSKTVETEKNVFHYDFLIIALGADAIHSSKGAENSFNLYDIKQAEKIHQALEKIQKGFVSIVVTKTPFKCPAAPYEAAFLVEDFFRKKNKRNNIQIKIFSPEPQPMPVAGKKGGDKIKEILLQKNIEFFPNQKLVEIRKKSILFEDLESESDLTLAVPVHSLPSVIKNSKITEKDWIEVDKKSLKTVFENVFAIGDCAAVQLANGMLLPKAGVLAEEEAKIVANNIAAEITGGEKKAFHGNGYCFVETGNGKATIAEGNFFAEPSPQLEIREPSEEFRKQKIAFEKERIKRWFGKQF